MRLVGVIVYCVRSLEVDSWVDGLFTGVELAWDGVHGVRVVFLYN